ncbi:DNA polymerase I [Bifidobacterium choloepi]|uniref:DNA-directed DNA polymerase n=1 Tax=Bifidobacterium choloepi TaxID=2614131 RepID=A0A6I5NCV2_9BIFI|nr:DNA polymerase I [Bifidobacterium choloepi]NEG69294.1 DNA polymerase I [Bifidobacterium choloepi]
MSESTEPAAERGTLLVIDGHSLAFRAFYAYPVDSFSNGKGQATNAVYGFLVMLADVIRDEHPDRLAVAFDVRGGTFRDEMLGQYKATRTAPPEDFLTQLPLIQQALTALGVTYLEKPGYEGDDIIATLATMGERDGYSTLVVSGDRDSFQLVDDRTTVLYPGYHFSDLKRMTPAAVEEKYHVTPAQYPDLAALRGETSDNIPGVPGVGDGFAAKWLAQYGSLEGVLENADKIKGKKGEALRENIEQVRLNRRVNALVRDLDLDVSMDELAFGNVDAAATTALFDELQFGKNSRRKILTYFGRRGDGAADGGGTAGRDSRVGRRPASGTSGAVFSDGVVGTGDSVEIATTVDEIATAQDLRGWAAGHLTVPAAAGAPDNADRTDVVAELDHASDRCVDDVDRSWSLLADGSPKPGASSLVSVTLLAADGHAVTVATADATTDAALHDALQDVLDRYAATAAVHSLKETMHMLAAGGYRLPMPLFDTKLAGYLVEPDFSGATLADYTQHFLDVTLADMTGDAADGEGETQGTLDLLFADDDSSDKTGGLSDDARATQAAKAALVAALARHLAPELERREQVDLLRVVEMPVSVVLFRMEQVGVDVDRQRFSTMLATFSEESSRMEQLAWQAAGHEVKLKSPKQLGEVLFGEMGLTPTKKTKKGAPTTNAAALVKLYATSEEGTPANEFLGAVLRFRETNKLEQIVQSLTDAVNPADGRIHTTFEQTVAATGRLSSVDPNLQNIPNRNAEGREIRSAFVAGPGTVSPLVVADGLPAGVARATKATEAYRERRDVDFTSLLSADYSQVELRIMADLSGDEALIDAFKSGVDFHRYVASLVYGIPADRITPDQRSHVKAMSYGLAYGLSSYGLSQQLGITPHEADALKAQYFAVFGKVHDYLESLVATARKRGYTETMFGRRRYFPALASANRTAREAAERAALNAPIQGSAADIMKIAMIRAERMLREGGYLSRIVLQIHDELVVELAPGETDAVTALVRDAMEHAVDLAVPLDVSTGVGADWQLAAH